MLLLLIAFSFVVAFCQGERHPICFEPKDPGPCRAYVRNYYYDYRTNSCLPFYYGGCGGTHNRFFTWKACLQVCSERDTDWVLKKRPNYSWEGFDEERK
ncbi:unnamed protein product [Mesocestoides corti]|uniref:BPTI/Kunitz inhibitor domain-containing protein n=1 Tax=Mesocestoides corti TaxID=53468 RepID=A0A158QV67_MESCO|nr:unnamed protein product [Mesocestoides corti]